MQTTHEFYLDDSRHMSGIRNDSIHLIVTSPPYPMVEMWDTIFANFNSKISKNLKQNKLSHAFNEMHEELENVWRECYRVLIAGGILCINIGDATRKAGNIFQLFSNHTQIIQSCLRIGFINLPNIIWRKPANSPTKFMGSGMLPPGGYVTLEHEYILIFRKGGKREFKTPEEKRRRRENAIFWEERNQWFSDVWMDLRGIGQDLKGANPPRQRSGAFPLELAYRLIQMFSLRDDTVLDPFVGTGTTSLASSISGRNSRGYEINPDFIQILKQNLAESQQLSTEYLENRLENHYEFIENRSREGKQIKYQNSKYGFPVVSRQEQDMIFTVVTDLERGHEPIRVNYETYENK